MSPLSDDPIQVLPGEGMRRTLLCLVAFGAVAVSVVFSPAAGLWHPQSAMTRLAVIQP